jgi:threonine synthase
VSIRYTCGSCGSGYTSNGLIYRCPKCAGPGSAAHSGFQKGNLSVEFDPAPAARKVDPVDPLTFLPFAVRGAAGFPAGGTPLVQPSRLRAAEGFPNLFLKLDNLNPSGSLKDRASLLVAEHAMLLGERRVVLASTGNAGASMACAAAAYGLEVILFVPAAAPKAKLLQSLLYGARVVPVRGSYDDAFALSIQYTDRYGGVNRNTGYNPLTVEGKKTVSIELWNQLGGRVPDVVYVPTGDGVIFSGACKGFADLVNAGCADRMPVMVAVQAEGSNAIARSFREGREVTLERASTIADSLAVASPASGHMAIDNLRRFSGRAIEVSDAEISQSQGQLCREAGVFVEPSSAAACAGFLKDRRIVDPGATVVVLLTGTGFKDTTAAEKLISLPAACAPVLEDAVRLLADQYGMRESF